MVFISQKLSDEEKQMVKGQLKNCQKTEGATDDQVDNFLSGKDLNTQQAKCMAICALEQFAVVREPEHTFSHISRGSQ